MRATAGQIEVHGRKPVKRRTYNVRLIRRDLSYSIQEIAELYDLHPQAVRRWVKSGLPTIDDRRPIYVHGTDLFGFLKQRQAARRRRCAPDEFYCCRCRAPRRVDGNRVTILHQTNTKLLLRGTCEACSAPVNKAGSAAGLDDYGKRFALEAATARHLDARSDPVVMCHSKEETASASIQPQE
jgi:hypothetical protein